MQKPNAADKARLCRIRVRIASGVQARMANPVEIEWRFDQVCTPEAMRTQDSNCATGAGNGINFSPQLIR